MSQDNTDRYRWARLSPFPMRRESFVYFLLIMAVLGMGCTKQLAAQDAKTEASPFLVNIGKGVVDLSQNGLNVHDCMLVRPDGHFHFERRRQQLPRKSATLEIFESSLDSGQLEQLRNILSDQQIQNLPPYVQPAFPMSVPWYGIFHADIARAKEVQSIGYFMWRGGTSDTSPNSAADNVKKAWRDSEEALRPLVEWFSKVEAMKMDPSNAKSTPTLCDVNAGGDGSNGEER